MPNIHTLRKVSILIIVLFSLVSCRQSETVSIIPDQNPPTESNNFGFNLNDFNVFHDTIRRGDTFGSIIENQNLGDMQVYDIIEKVKKKTPKKAAKKVVKEKPAKKAAKKAVKKTTKKKTTKKKPSKGKK